MAVNEEGEVVCADDKCLEVRGGNIGDAAAGVIKGALELAAGLLPGASSCPVD